MVALLMAATLPTHAWEQRGELVPLRLVPARSERARGGRLGRRERLVDDLLAGLREHDERKPRIAFVRLSVDESHPLERRDLPCHAGRRDPESARELGPAQLAVDGEPELAQNGQV